MLTVSCNQSKSCEKFIDENYDKHNSNLPDSVRSQIESYLINLEEPSIHNSKFETYRLLTSYALSNRYNSFLFQKKGSISELTFKEHEYDPKTKTFETIEETRKLLSESEWAHLQYLIYKFEFWTEKEMKIREGVTDGYSYVLEGCRPQAKLCSKKTNKLLLRVNSADTDNIKWLCDDLISIYLHTE